MIMTHRVKVTIEVVDEEGRLIDSKGRSLSIGKYPDFFRTEQTVVESDDIEKAWRSANNLFQILENLKILSTGLTITG